MRGSRKVPLLVGASVMALAVGCGEAGPDRSVSRVDSAGITLVQSTAPAWDTEEGWRLGSEPLVSIGGLDVPEEQQLFSVRGVLRLEDDRIVTAHATTGEIRYFDASGRFERAVGRSGEGPEEFGRIFHMSGFGPDSLIFWDAGNARYAVYHRDGTFGRTFVLSRGDGQGIIFPGPYPVILENRTLMGFTQLPVRDQEPGLYRARVTYQRFAPDGAWLGEFLTVPFRTFYVQRSGDQMAMTSAPFGRETVVHALGNTVWVGRGEGYTLAQYSPSGELLARITDGTYEPVPVEARHLREYIDEQVERVRGMAQRMGSNASWLEMQTANVRSVQAPETFPPYSRVKADHLGNLWVQDYALPDEPANRWAVFDADGALLGRLDLPDRFQVAEIGPDWILGLWQDDLDIEYVQLYAIEKTQADT